MTAMTRIPPAQRAIVMDDQLPVYDARDLTQDGTLARIALNDQIYTLRITRSGKLILTK